MVQVTQSLCDLHGYCCSGNSAQMGTQSLQKYKITEKSAPSYILQRNCIKLVVTSFCCLHLPCVPYFVSTLPNNFFWNFAQKQFSCQLKQLKQFCCHIWRRSLSPQNVNKQVSFRLAQHLYNCTVPKFGSSHLLLPLDIYVGNKISKVSLLN